MYSVAGENNSATQSEKPFRACGAAHESDARGFTFILVIHMAESAVAIHKDRRSTYISSLSLYSKRIIHIVLSNDLWLQDIARNI